MQNKVLIKLIMPEIDREFDVFIPVNEVVWKMKRLVIKSISDLADIPLDPKSDYKLINKDSFRLYSNNEIIINTDIRNATELIMISK